VPEPRLSDGLVERVLARLGLATPRADSEDLGALYLAWSRAVPWDNVQKRISVAERHRILAGAEPEEFFENWLRHGTGGTCWPSSGAWHALLVALGFDARRVIGTMHPDRVPAGTANHASEIVRSDGEDWLVDSSMLNERPLPLHRGEPTRIDDPLHAIRAEPRPDALWHILWSSYVRPEMIPCLLFAEDVAHDAYLERYELSRVRGFSYGLTFRRNTAAGVLSVQRSTRTFKDRGGAIAQEEVRDRAGVLVDEGGLSPEIVRRLPEDEPEPPR